jgi:LysM repeat protein
LAVFANSSVFSQDDDDDDDMSSDEEMDSDQWQAQMDEYTARKADLTAQLSSLDTEITQLRFSLQTRTNEAENAVNSVWAAVGSLSQYEEYKSKFADAEKKVAACKGPDDAAAIERDVWPYLTDAGINNRMKCLPEFWDRYNSMKKKIADCKALAPKMEGYTVVKGDCLYKIAGMNNIYGNSRLWPAIWDANKNGVVSAPPRVKTTIPNPNLIYPGQVLKIPALTDAQKSAALERGSTYRSTRKTRVKKTEGDTEMKKPDGQ